MPTSSMVTRGTWVHVEAVSCIKGLTRQYNGPLDSTFTTKTTTSTRVTYYHKNFSLPHPSNREYRISLLPVCTSVSVLMLNVGSDPTLIATHRFTPSATQPSFTILVPVRHLRYLKIRIVRGPRPHMKLRLPNNALTSFHELGLLDAHKFPMAQWLQQDRTCPSSHRNPSSASSTHAKAEQQWSDSRSRKGGRRKEEGNSRGACYASSPHEMIINIRASPSTDVTLESSSMSTETKLSLGFTKEDSDRVGVIMEP